MSSLALLMQNYSDSEDDGSSGDERKKQRIQRKEAEQANEKDLNEQNIAGETDCKRDAKLTVEANEKKSNLDATGHVASPEITPTLNQMKLGRQVEQSKIDYDQDYLDDDFFTLNNNGDLDCDDDDDELNANDNSSTSIIQLDDNEKVDNGADIDVSSYDDTKASDHNEKLDCGQLSPKSFHRLLIGIDEQKIQIPEAPHKPCSKELTQKIINYHTKMKQGMDVNKSIQSMKQFRNPSIYEKLIGFCNIDEFGTNLPVEIFDPDQFREKESNELDTSG